MTTEDDFQATLDSNPEDWQTRLVFADWLQERGDPRADGYRALGVHARRFDVTTSSVWWLGNADEPAIATAATSAPQYLHRQGILPQDWFQGVSSGQDYHRGWRMFNHRREAEDAAALAFAKLPPKRRAELLAGMVTKLKTTKSSKKPKPKKKPKGKK